MNFAILLIVIGLMVPTGGVVYLIYLFDKKKRSKQSSQLNMVASILNGIHDVKSNYVSIKNSHVEHNVLVNFIDVAEGVSVRVVTIDSLPLKTEKERNNMPHFVLEKRTWVNKHFFDKKIVRTNDLAFDRQYQLLTLESEHGLVLKIFNQDFLLKLVPVMNKTGLFMLIVNPAFIRLTLFQDFISHDRILAGVEVNKILLMRLLR